MVESNDSDEGPVDLAVGKVVAKRFLIHYKCGEGGCGTVYKVEDLEKKKHFYALKAESNSASGGAVLKLEVAILRRLQGRKHFAELIQSGKRERYSYMVMTLFGPSLSYVLKKKVKGDLSISSTVRIGIQLLYCIKTLHDAGYIHRDIKPGNLALGRHFPQSRFLYMLDFGLSREHITRDGDKVLMRRPRTDTLFRGTPKYCSISTHERNEQGRPDDLWSLVYLIAELRGPLPWEDLSSKHDIKELKKRTPDTKLLANCPIQMLEITAHLRSLTYYTRPNYFFIYKKFMEVMKEGGFKFTDPYDWEKTVMAKKKRIRHDGESTSLHYIKHSADSGNSPSFCDEDFTSNPLGF
ncbi:unnamed protein product [Bursaphelenchus xylophilus]|uniref:(pine wood nematode) hypothetical protein n=1 Tax=Bursaphelenchus xylophilus TaxID=6326 RepID=A0A1I7S5Z4_BURXY|nr:unnamed protein product [Bursaphelenchus xylophilus]CAG9082475.1 unnamed protein product [Bursaphelenchus xylophilus]